MIGYAKENKIKQALDILKLVERPESEIRAKSYFILELVNKNSLELSNRIFKEIVDRPNFDFQFNDGIIKNNLTLFLLKTRGLKEAIGHLSNFDSSIFNFLYGYDHKFALIDIIDECLKKCDELKAKDFIINYLKLTLNSTRKLPLENLIHYLNNINRLDLIEFCLQQIEIDQEKKKFVLVLCKILPSKLGLKQTQILIDKIDENFHQNELNTSWLTNLNIVDCNKICLIENFNQFNLDINKLRYFLNVYALHELLFTDANPEKIQRLNRTLNIQWAMDIRAIK